MKADPSDSETNVHDLALMSVIPCKAGNHGNKSQFMNIDIAGSDLPGGFRGFDPPTSVRQPPHLRHLY